MPSMWASCMARSTAPTRLALITAVAPPDCPMTRLLCDGICLLPIGCLVVSHCHYINTEGKRRGTFTDIVKVFDFDVKENIPVAWATGCSRYFALHDTRSWRRKLRTPRSLLRSPLALKPVVSFFDRLRLSSVVN